MMTITDDVFCHHLPFSFLLSLFLLDFTAQWKTYIFAPARQLARKTGRSVRP